MLDATVDFVIMMSILGAFAAAGMLVIMGCGLALMWIEGSPWIPACVRNAACAVLDWYNGLECR